MNVLTLDDMPPPIYGTSVWLLCLYCVKCGLDRSFEIKPTTEKQRLACECGEHYWVEWTDPPA